MKAPSDSGTNSSTRHVLEAMQIIAQSVEPLGLAEVAERLDLPPSTAHRALMTLEESGFAQRIAHVARFTPGDRLHHLIRSMVALFPIRNVACGPFRDLSEELDVTVSLNWRIGWHSLRLYSIEGSHEAYQLRRIGEARPLHDGIGPVAILAALPEQEREAYGRFRHDQAKPFKLSGLAQQVADMTAQGYLTLGPADATSLHWISAPLRRPDGSVVASMSVGFGITAGGRRDMEADIETALARMSDFQQLLDSSTEHTRSPYDALAPHEYRTHSSPSIRRAAE
jgi:DNA-binding IclR family transcriptional regulator